MQKNKRAAIEMSMSTIVVIVLSVMLLIGGISLITNIFGAGEGMLDSSSAQVQNQIQQLFKGDEKLVVYPDTKTIEIKKGKKGNFLFWVRNDKSGIDGSNTQFEYDVSVSNAGNCGVPEDVLQSYLILGDHDTFKVEAGEYWKDGNALFEIPSSGAPLCTFNVKVNIEADGNFYAQGIMYVSIT
jgi:hypothetical protein